MDPDQSTAPTGSTLFVKEASKTFQQTIKAEHLCCIGALRVDKCEFQFIYGHDFHDMHAGLCNSSKLLTMLNVNQIKNIF